MPARRSRPPGRRAPPTPVRRICTPRRRRSRARETHLEAQEYVRARLAALQAKRHAAAALAARSRVPPARGALQSPAPLEARRIDLAQVIRRFRMSGKVQGVYFRHSTRSRPSGSRLRGYARNLAGWIGGGAGAGRRPGRSSDCAQWLHRGPRWRGSRASPNSSRSTARSGMRAAIAVRDLIEAAVWPLEAPDALPALHHQGRVGIAADAAVVARERARPVAVFDAQVVAQDLAAHADVRRDAHQLILHARAGAARTA